jgi:hypothetical protein
MTYEIWGLAAGHGSTKEAARGAFTQRHYPSREAYEKAHLADWLSIVSVTEHVD